MHSKRIELVILLYLLAVFCIPSTMGIYKRGGNTTGSVIAATWDVSLNQTGVNNTLSVAAGGSDVSYTLNVVSNSEVDVIYTVVVSNIPSGVVVKLDSGSFQTPVSNTVTFTDVDTIHYNDQTKQKTHTLTFRANSGASAVNSQSVSVDVKFKQDL